MACNEKEENIMMISGITKKEGTVLVEFKAGVVRSMKQYNSGLVKTFDNVDDFLADLRNPE
jgi:hypothetical protein